MEKQTYFIYVRKFSNSSASYDLYVYKVTTDNVYRIIGKIVVSTIEHIQRIDFCRWSPVKEEFWNERGVKIIDYVETHLSEDL